MTKAKEQGLSCTFIRTDDEKEDFDIFKLSMKYLDILNHHLKKHYK